MLKFGCTAVILYLVVVCVAIAGWVQHVITCIQNQEWILLVIGCFLAPIGSIHGVCIWLGILTY